MKTIKKTTCLEIIERLSEYEILGHPVMLGDVLDRLLQNLSPENKQITEFLYVWWNCGLSQSLQQILEGAEVKTEYHEGGKDDIIINFHSGDKASIKPVEIIKSPEVSELFIFLNKVL